MVLGVGALLFLSYCTEPKTQKETNRIKYAFFVAGHTYGNPMHDQLGLYPPFKNRINQINKTPKIELGIFTGDVVKKPSPDYWQAALDDINLFNVPIHIAKGNHDGTQIFDSIFNQTYYAFNHQNDLFIIP